MRSGSFHVSGAVWAGLAAMLALGPVAGCGHRRKAETAPKAPPPPEVTTVFPAPRSTGIACDAEVWAQFSVPLDPSSVNAANVRLRLDTRRVPVDIRWETETRRIRIRPLVQLDAARTHTIELRPGLAAAGGVLLGHLYSWQFTTFGARRPDAPQPASGTIGESPYAMLSWDSTASTAGIIAYRLYASTDSAQVAARSGPVVATPVRPYWLPTRRWNLGSSTYWSITAVNQTTGDELSGPVWRFDTLPASTPEDSVVLQLSDWGQYDAALNEFGVPFGNSCFGGSFSTGGARYTSGFRWDLGALRGKKLASAAMRMGLGTPLRNLSRVQPTLWYAIAPWSACALGSGGPPYTEIPGKLVDAVFLNELQLRFSSDLLTSHLEAMLRRQGFYGYIPRSTGQVDYQALFCSLSLHFYRTEGGLAALESSRLPLNRPKISRKDGGRSVAVHP